MQAFQNVLKSSKHIIVVAGAGLSAASGIPTFRGAGGFWRKYGAISLATPKAFKRNPSRVWQFYHYRREKARAAVPNAAHYALAAFSVESIRHIIAPGSTFTLITQNVDGLSQHALDKVYGSLPTPPVPPEQPVLLEMHGRLFEVACTSGNDEHTVFDPSSPVCEALRGTELLMEENAIEPNIKLADLPRCKTCGALARPGVVWFEEVPRYMDKIDDLVEKADLCIVVGTSSTVQPAASYASEVQEYGGKVAVFNLERKTLPKALGLEKNELVAAEPH
ncbi:hypothetical protein EUX98_g394 [Antrodiella citrinella]|uniref:Deacetylase sirtuin-type domain-containing protein n=1 Tax=Antrodiella citrinella TaxID=2447956 RepID=A0A4S4N3X0_9APHY|nr:hypothetical protein EUX98_g394 [Antrodiella citrinella]